MAEKLIIVADKQELTYKISTYEELQSVVRMLAIMHGVALTQGQTLSVKVQRYVIH